MPCIEWCVVILIRLSRRRISRSSVVRQLAELLQDDKNKSQRTSAYEPNKYFIDIYHIFIYNLLKISKNFLEAKIKKTFQRVNYLIRVPRVFLIDDTGKAVGDIETSKAMELAEEKNLDMVEVDSDKNPPICKLMDYGKFVYKQERTEKKQKTKSLKETRISLKISQHDEDIKAQKTKKFLEKGHSVRISMFLRGRENIFASEAFEKIKRFANQFSNIAKTIGAPAKQGNIISITINPK